MSVRLVVQHPLSFARLRCELYDQFSQHESSMKGKKVKRKGYDLITQSRYIKFPPKIPTKHQRQNLGLIIHHSAPSSFSFEIMPSTSSTLPPPCLAAGSVTLTVFKRWLRSMPYSSIFFLTRGFFLAFMIFGKLA